MSTTAALALPRPATADLPANADLPATADLPDNADLLVAAELRHVTVATHRRHRHQLILDNVTAAIHRGEVVAVLSRHDTAASTFLDLLDGRLSPTWGWVVKHGHIARVLPPYGVQARLTVRQNLVVAQRRSGWPTDADWADQVAELMGLRGMLGYRAPEAADARRARWAIARALMARPSVVLVNGVTAGLDRRAEREVLAALRAAARELGVGVVLATRDPVSASDTDRVLLLRRGKVVDDTAAS